MFYDQHDCYDMHEDLIIAISIAPRFGIVLHVRWNKDTNTVYLC